MDNMAYVGIEYECVMKEKGSDLINFDFETYYNKIISKKLTTIYVRDPRFEVLGIKLR